jgi:hypothetical protein
MNSQLLQRLVKVSPFAMTVLSMLFLVHGLQVHALELHLHAVTNGGDPGNPCPPN